MDASRYERLMDLFDEACDLPLEKQQAFVAQLRASDPPLADQLAGLLEHDARDTPVFDRGAGAAVLAQDIEAQADSSMPPAAREGAQVGNWIVGDFLGQGGVGSVYKARHRLTGGEAAIKFLKSNSDAESDTVRRFQREFKAVANLDHPNCLQVYEQGRSPHGHYFVMQYAAGGDMRSMARAPVTFIAPLLAQAADALAHVHAKGIVHRDLKPANLLMTDETPIQVLIADFGIARVLDATAIITGTGAVMGSIDFMAPEQINGQVADWRSDLYAFGCTLFTLVTGRPAFEGDNFEKIHGRLRGEPPILSLAAPQTPPTVSTLCRHLMTRDPARRPASFTVVAEVLRAL